MSSLSSLHRTKSHSIRSEPTLLTKEQKHTVKVAANMLSQQQRQQIQQWNNKLTIRWDSTSSWGEGPAQSKGKAVDPREWGNANLSKADMDIAAQAAALNSFKPVVKTIDTAKKNTPCQAQNIKAHRLDTHHHFKQYNLAPVPAAPHAVWPAKSWPAAQLAPRSYLGAALQKAGTSQRIKPQHQGSVSGSSEPSDSTDILGGRGLCSNPGDLIRICSESGQMAYHPNSMF